MEHSIATEDLDSLRSKPGKPYPLGATWDGEGVNFALFSEHATGITLCLFDANDSTKEIASIPVTEQTEYIWHIYLDGVKPGQLYGYRAEGPFDAAQGLLFNSKKLLMDPYAKAVNAPFEHHDSQLTFDPRNQKEDHLNPPNKADSAPHVPKSVVIDSAFDWEDDKSPDRPLNESVIYELHVKGFTQLHPTLDEAIRGSYAGLGSPEAIDYLKSLGVTTIELMPVHQFTADSYWGYNSIAFFAPHNAYSSSGMTGQQVNEFKEMVKAMHKAGLEVILDVVYNHTAEGNQNGPTLSFKGLDNPAYYWLVDDNKAYYMDHTGTGNTFNMGHPRTLQLVMDSLRYWVTEMHVDGFRFDLATALAHSLSDAGQLSAFFDTAQQDPVLCRVKLIAEPWDIQSYEVGNFPVNWSEWNGKYRDCVRSYWKGDEGKIEELALRLTGSPDLYADDGRKADNSINLITAHDGFTLNDLVSYNEKHNDANGEDNQDGANDNNSWNCGVEGPTDDPEINRLREKQKRNLLATLLLSQGTPMIVMGDECSRTQQGNNNVYGQDNELSWFDWDWDSDKQALFNYTQQLIKLRLGNPLLHRSKFYSPDEITWLRPDGRPMEDENWQESGSRCIRCIGLMINGTDLNEQDENGNPIKGDYLLLLLNSHWEEVPFKLPTVHRKYKWERLLNTDLDDQLPAEPSSHELLPLAARSVVLLKCKYC